MSTVFAIQTIIEIFLALLVVWCFINQKKLIRFEDKVWAYIVYRRRRRKKFRAMEHIAKLNARSAYSPKKANDEPLHVA